MSRIGKKPIPLPSGVKYKVEGNTGLVEGPKVFTKCCTQDCWMAALLATPVSSGLLPVMFLPLAEPTPLPASEL